MRATVYGITSFSIVRFQSCTLPSVWCGSRNCALKPRESRRVSVVLMMELGVLVPAKYVGTLRSPRFGRPSGDNAAFVTLYVNVAPTGTEEDCAPTQSCSFCG